MSDFKDLMAEIVSSMKSQISFLTPAISGIVVGITSMIAQLLGSLGDYMQKFEAGSNGDISGAMSLFKMFGSGGISTFHFQAIVGLYVVEITFILSVLVNGIQNGADKIRESDIVGNNLVRSTLIYVVIAGIFSLAFSLIAVSITNSITLTPGA